MRFLGTNRENLLERDEDEGWKAERKRLPMVNSHEMKPNNNGLASGEIAVATWSGRGCCT
jgi:hypothetical protein